MAKHTPNPILAARLTLRGLYGDSASIGVSEMMQGIWTSRYGTSDVKAIARTRNSWGGEQPEMALRLSYDYALNADENHAAVAAALALKLGWDGLWHGGGRPDNKGYMFVKIASAYQGAPDSSIGREGVDWFYIEPRA